MDVLNLPHPYGSLMGKGKKTAVLVADGETLPVNTDLEIRTGDEVFGVVVLGHPAKMLASEVDRDEYFKQHQVFAKKRKARWPDADQFVLYPVERFEKVTEQEDWRGDGGPGPPGTVERGNKADSPDDGADPVPGGPGSLKEEDDMPYDIEERDGEFCVVKTDTDETEKCHASKPEAEAHLAALRINVEAEEDDADKALKEAELLPVEEDAPDPVLALTDEQKQQMVDLVLAATEAAEKLEAETGPEAEDEAEPMVEEKSLSKRLEEKDALLQDALDRLAELEAKAEPEAEQLEPEPDVVEELEVAQVEPDEVPGDDDKAGRRVQRPMLDKIKDAVENLLEVLGWGRYEDRDVEMVDLFKGTTTGLMLKEVGGEPGLVTWTTNAFIDRDEEIFSTKGLEQYVQAAGEAGERGQYNLWHVPGTEFADVKWQAVIGRFLVEAGQFTKDARGDAAQAFFNQYPARHPKHAPEGWGCSPEFRYLPEERSKGVYENFWITDRAVLPRMAAANIRTRATGGNIMAITKQQQELGEEMLGKEEMETIVQDAEAETAKNESDGIAHKDADAEAEAEVEQVVEEEAVEEQEQSEPEPVQPEMDVAAVADELMKRFAVSLEPLNEFAGQLEALGERMVALEKADADRKEVGATKYQLSLERKRATEADETVVPEDDELLKEKPAEASVEKTGAANFFGPKR